LSSISSNAVYSLYEDPSGDIWLGTRNGGLCTWHRDTGIFTHVTSKDGLPSDTVVGVIPSGGNLLWIATQNGLVRFDRAKKSFVVYRTMDGLLSQQFNSALLGARDGTRYFGTPLGLVSFHEGDILPDSVSIPSVSLSSLTVNNQRLPLPFRTDDFWHVTLSNDQKNLTIGYTVLDFSPLAKHTCSYRLDGYDRYWTSSGDRNLAVYTNLWPGTYRFRVRVDGVNDNEYGPETSFVFTIKKPAFFSWYAMLAYLAIIIAIVCGARKIHRATILARKVDELEATASNLQSEKSLLETLSYQDPLTGIANRRYFEYVMAREWEAAKLRHDILSVLMIDIDFFKRYNDTLGHVAGDAALRTVAGAIHSALFRVSDVVARYGGEEFVVILPDTNAENVEIVCERIRNSLAACRMEFPTELGEFLTISIGAYTGTPTHELSFDRFICRADEALYRSKENGRNRVSIYTDATYEV
jgi:diguanylate cyclase (GGDEF)-like protein